MKKSKGITLIALIITIVILIILAVVAVKEISGDGIISKALVARDDYKEAQLEEELNLACQEYTIDKISGTTTKTLLEYLTDKGYTAENGYTVIDNGDGTVTIEKGDINITINSETGEIIQQQAGFNATEWDKTATPETIFNWGSDDESNSSYGVITRIKDEYKTEYTQIKIPSRCIDIAADVFWGCTSLTSITVPNSVTSIGETAFKNCTSLTSITIPNSLTNIGDFAFYNCTNLTNITIPTSVINIGQNAFEEWTSSQTINCRASSKPSGWDNDWNLNSSAKVIWGYTGD